MQDSLKRSRGRIIELDGESLSPFDVVDIGHQRASICISSSAWERVRASRLVVESVLDRNEVVYGINTGFGKFSDVVIPRDRLSQLQRNLILSHSAGTGDPLTRPQTRMLLCLRINVLAKGHSGISAENLHKLVSALNADCLPVVPSQGTVGASGDLAPLAHLALGLLGEGDMWDPRTGEKRPAGAVLRQHGLEPLQLGPKEGLALINGTQLITALGCEAAVRAARVSLQADIVAALTLDVLRGTVAALSPLVHSARPHKGQGAVAERMRRLLHSDRFPSELSVSHKNCGQVQDAYTLRCVPQVHGVVHDTIEFVLGMLATECNSATDNPMVFAEQGLIISGGNFHGEYPAKALDYLAIAVHEIANISERRIERLVNPNLSGLPAFLVTSGGLNSGLMMAHCTAAALVSENKTLCHPASVDSLSTSAAKEDHVSMGGWAARKAIQVVRHVETVLAIELMASCQALEFHRPLSTTAPLEAVHEKVRSKIPALDEDRFLAPDIQAVVELIQQGCIWEAVQKSQPSALPPHPFFE